MARGVVFVIGASGVGKTAAVEWLADQASFPASYRHFDSIEIPPVEEMCRVHGSPEGWQEHETRAWVARLVALPDDLVVFEGQTRPSFLVDAAETHGLTRYQIVLLECSDDARAARLARRGQAELDTEQMGRWGAYLRGQADALGLPVIDTSDLSVPEVGTALRAQARQLAADA